MKKKGILFTYSIFVLALLLLSSALVVKNQQIRIGSKSALVNAVNSVNNKFYNIEFDIIDLDKNGANLTLQQRVLPFNYFFKDENSLRIEQVLPLAQGTIDNYIDMLNAYAIFASDTDAQTTYDAMNIDFNVIKNPDWGGTQENLMFNILPFCLQFFESTNLISLKQLTNRNCKKAFDINSVKRFDINISIANSFDDYNVINCNLDGFSGCPNDAFDPGNEFPYFELKVNQKDCDNCYLGENDINTISGHYNPMEQNSILILCSAIPSSSCNSSNSIQIQLMQGIEVSFYGSNAFDLNIETDFNSAIKRFYSLDINAEVKKYWGTTGNEDIYIIKSTNW